VDLSIADPVAFPEGDSGNTNLIFTVNRSGDPAPALRVARVTTAGEY